MTTLLNQALILTLVGMGMTFGALGLLVLGMYAMTALFTDKPRRKETPPPEAPAEKAFVTQVADVALHLAAFASSPSAEAVTAQPQDEGRQRAAAVAVALALTLEDDTPHPADRYRAAVTAVAVAFAEAERYPAAVARPAAPETWNTHTRRQHLTRK